MSGEHVFIDGLLAGKVKSAGAVEATSGILGKKAVTVLTATKTVLASESGTIFILNSATEFASTLPRPEAGLHYTFIVGAAPSGANYTIKSYGDANIIHGQIVSAEDAAGSVSTAAAADIVNFVSAKAIVGDRVDVVSDGTNWYITGFCNVQDAITTVQTA